MNAHDSIKIEKSGIAQAVPLFVCCGLILLVTPLWAVKKQAQAVSALAKLSDREREAACGDLPLPVGGVLQPAVSSDTDEKNSGCSLTYRVKISREEATSFYEQGMMQLGWHKIAHKRGAEDVLVYETPRKIALVGLRPEKAKKGWKRNKRLILTLQELPKEQEAELV